MMDDSFQFLLIFPCYVLEFERDNMVGIPAGDGRGLAILTDIDLAERLVDVVLKKHNRTSVTVEIADEPELLRRLLIAKEQGASCLAIDPQLRESPQLGFEYREILIDHAIDHFQNPPSQ